MNRQRVLLSSTILLVAAAIAYWVWSGWGLVTVKVNGKPLSEVIRSIEKQGGIVLKTNMDATKPVTMHVDKVPLTEALETLAEVTDSRWRVGYLFAADTAALKGALDTSSGKRPEGWKNFDVPLFGRPGSLGETVVPMDPRTDTWKVGEPGDKTLHGYLQSAALGVSALFSCPEEFNPEIGAAPSPGEIGKVAPQLAKAAGAKLEEVFLLLGRPAGIAEGDRPREEGGEDGRPRRGGPDGGGLRNFELFRQRQLAEIEKLPAGEQPAARAEFDERDKFFSALQSVPEAERRAKVEEYFNNPANQERMAERRMSSEERKTPEQRRERYQKYVQKKQQAMNSQKK
ncbi:MAG: hemophore-related protein [Chthoniobacteraceae bacterium]